MGWLQLVGPLQLFFSFAEYRLFYRDILFSEDKVDLLTIVRLFCRISSLLYISFAKETYNFKILHRFSRSLIVRKINSNDEGSWETMKDLEIVGLFCKRDIEKRRYSAKETYDCTRTSLSLHITYIHIYISIHMLIFDIHIYTYAYLYICWSLDFFIFTYMIFLQSYDEGSWDCRSLLQKRHRKETIFCKRDLYMYICKDKEVFLQSYVSFAEYRLFSVSLLQKRPTISRSFIVGTNLWTSLSLHIYIYRSLLQNIVSFLCLFCKRDLQSQDPSSFELIFGLLYLYIDTYRSWETMKDLEIVGLFCKRDDRKETIFCKRDLWL